MTSPIHGTREKGNYTGAFPINLVERRLKINDVRENDFCRFGEQTAWHDALRLPAAGGATGPETPVPSWFEAHIQPAHGSSIWKGRGDTPGWPIPAGEQTIIGDTQRALRAGFLANWIAQPDATALACVRNGRVRGYGVLRRCKAGYKIGPLFADTPEIANALFDGLAAHAMGEVIALDVPEVNRAAVALAERNGMTCAFETARMYRGVPPAIEVERIFGVTSFEPG